MKGRHSGFTLIELMVTLAIVALLSAIVLPMAEITLQRQKEQELRIALREIRTAIDAFKQAVDEGRVMRPASSSGYPRDLDALVLGVKNARDPKGRKIYFLRQVPRDPFYPDSQTTPAETWGKRSYASEADAPREGEDVFDVYSLSEQRGLNGVAYRQW